MQLWVGLGNPGGAYAQNRHNVGFLAIDRIAADYGFPPFRARFQGLVSEGRVGEERIALLKPQTFMNLSGQSVGEAMRYLKLTPADVTVFHDELDLAPFRVRLKTGGGHAGHNGLRSLHAHIGEGYGRVRLGIGHPGDKDRVAGYVLSDFAKAEVDGLDDLLRGIADGAPLLAKGDGPGFLNRVTARTAPPRPAAKPRRPEEPPEKAPEKAPARAARDAEGPPEKTPEETPKDPLRRLMERFR